MRARSSSQSCRTPASATCRAPCSRACSRTSRRCRRSPEAFMKAVAPKPAVGALERLSEELLESYLGDERARPSSLFYPPPRGAIAHIRQSVLDLLSPGFLGRGDLGRDNLGDYVAQA